MPRTTDRPFHEALADLMDEREISNRALAKRTKERHPAPEGEWSRRHRIRFHGHDRRMAESPGIAHTVVATLRRGDVMPSPRAVEIIADGLGISPEHFAEYRLDVAREGLEWRAPDPETRRRLLPLALSALGE